MRQQKDIKLQKGELKKIMAEYEPNDLEDDDETLLLKEAIHNALDLTDKIIFTLYVDMASEQKVADLLGTSRSPVHNLIVRCREQINNYLKDNTKDD